MCLFQEEDDGEKYEAPITRIMALNKPEWAQIATGCLATLIVGATLPFFAVLFGEVYGVGKFSLSPTQNLSLRMASSAKACFNRSSN